MNEESIGLLAARSADVRATLESYGIDYYCAGDRSLAEAAHRAGISEEDLRSRLEKANENEPATHWQDRSMRDLVTYLEHEHHQILRGIIFHSAMLLNEAASIDGAGSAAMQRTFRHFSDELILHIETEEHLFFPTLLWLEGARESGEPAPAAPGDVRKLVAAYVQQHAAIGSKLSQLRLDSSALAHNDSLIVHGLMNSLAALERHVHEYLNLENYVVFPRAIALDDDLQQSPRALSAARE